jgi:predicted regulator of Ras-like GTPase activity (Roadblock/LC7/MglB family)
VAAIQKSAKFAAILAQLCESASEFSGACVLNRDGLVVASQLAAAMDEDLTGALASTVLQNGQRMATELNQGQVEGLWMHTTSGQMLLESLGPDAMLVLFVSKDANLGLAMLAVQQAKEDLSKLV